ncbi:MAG: sugar ABC transporter ATP-binding protein [Desulfitobacterium hafniense]|nr:sugar ABC transporter ATP-binding protein [Desulfitobacterium hafniense]
MSNDILLKIEGISKSFPGVRALDNVSFDVEKGEVHAIVGENGAGKSTLMNILSGVYIPDAGRLLFDGDEVRFRDPRHAQETGIAMIHQELSLAHHLSVMENVYIGRLKKNKLGFIDHRGMFLRCKIELECLGISDIEPDALIKDLSVSQMQMVEIAKALSLNAKLIIMDEPTSSLTNKETEMLFAIIRSLKNKGVSVLYISHRMEEIFEISDKTTVLRDGTYIKTLYTKDTTPKELVSLMVGREFNRTFQRKNKEIKPDEIPILEVKSLSFGKKVKDVSFKVYPGEIVALTGLVGSGRSELVQTIFGLNNKDKGTILLNCERVEINSPTRAIELGLGMVPEGRKTQGLFLRMKVRENITMANLPRLCKMLFISNTKEHDAAHSYTSSLRIKTSSTEQQVQYLSGGNQQKTIIARWLLNNPRILILDEPTHGVDVGAKSEIYEIINKLAEEGVAIILISSELPEVLTLADRILVMHNGSISGELSREEANQEIIMQYATNQINKEMVK